MKYIYSLIVSCFIWCANVEAQIQTVTFDVVQNTINAGVPLPSEEPFYIRGLLPEGIAMVKVKVLRQGKSPNSANEYTWKTPFNYEVNNYELFISDPLRSGDNYSLEFSFYQRADEDQVQALKDALRQNLRGYVRSNLGVTRRGITVLSSDKEMIENLNLIVREGTSYYLHFINKEWPGFSDIVVQKLKQKNDLKMKNARFNILGKNKDNVDDDRAVYGDQYINELTQLIEAEVDQFLSFDMLSLVDVREMENYPTEKKQLTLPLNVGYGGIAFNTDFNNLDSDTGPYVGLSLPLGNRTFRRFLGNASISTGIFLINMENSAGDTVSGPVVGRPIYAGLGYTIFRIIRFNAGAALTSTSGVNSNADIAIHPFVGFSLEFNLWLGFNNKNR
ncbi:hypothetical protein [Pararhodonellum marinum]|uniref:hypothetical protein n=1 Tax=Pararhodonellum marinum TaxID=2755358 RepID=UPI0018900FC3|nr:hypothetical protein [Pararhodonellum marinum]